MKKYEPPKLEVVLHEVPTRKLLQVALFIDRLPRLDILKLYALLYSYPLRKDWERDYEQEK